MESEEKSGQKEVEKQQEIEKDRVDALTGASYSFFAMQETIKWERVTIEGVTRERDALKGILHRLKREGGSSAVAGGELNIVNQVGKEAANRDGEETNGLKSQLEEVQRETEACRTGVERKRIL